MSTKKEILEQIIKVKNEIKPQFEEFQKFLTEVRPKLVEEKKELDIKLEHSNYNIEDVKRLSQLHTAIYENPPEIEPMLLKRLSILYSRLANLDIKGGKRRKTMKKKQRKTKRKTMRKSRK